LWGVIIVLQYLAALVDAAKNYMKAILMKVGKANDDSNSAGCNRHCRAEASLLKMIRRDKVTIIGCTGA